MMGGDYTFADTDPDPCEPDFRSGFWMGFLVGNLSMLFLTALTVGIVTAIK